MEIANLSESQRDFLVMLKRMGIAHNTAKDVNSRDDIRYTTIGPIPGAELKELITLQAVKEWKGDQGGPGSPYDKMEYSDWRTWRLGPKGEAAANEILKEREG